MECGCLHGGVIENGRSCNRSSHLVHVQVWVYIPGDHQSIQLSRNATTTTNVALTGKICDNCILICCLFKECIYWHNPQNYKERKKETITTTTIRKYKRNAEEDNDKNYTMNTLASDSPEAIEVIIIIKLGTATASDVITHHVLNYIKLDLHSRSHWS